MQKSKVFSLKAKSLGTMQSESSSDGEVDPLTKDKRRILELEETIKQDKQTISDLQ